MPNHPRIPFDLLAMTYIHAVERGYPPAKTVRQKFRLTEKQWEHRRIHMGKLGWLPPGDPVRDGRARGSYDARWVRAAWAGWEAKLQERFEVVVTREHARQRAAQTMLLRAERSAALQLVAEARAERKAGRRPAPASRAVLDAFLGG